MSDRIALVAQLAWTAKQEDASHGYRLRSDEDYIRDAIAFVASVERLMQPEPSKCNSLGPQDLDFRPVCDLPNGHTGKHMDGGFVW